MLTISFSLAGCASLSSRLEDWFPADEKGHASAPVGSLDRYLETRLAEVDSAANYRPYIAVLPFTDDSDFDSRIWDLEHEIARFLSTEMQAHTAWHVIPYDAVNEVTSPPIEDDDALYSAARRLMADIVLIGTLLNFDFARTTVGDPLLGGYKSFRGVIELEVRAMHVEGRSSLGTLYSLQESKSRGLGLDLLGKPRRQDLQFQGLRDMTFGSEKFLATALGEATQSAAAELIENLVAKVRPGTITIDGDPPAVLSVHGDEVFVNVGTENAVQRGYRFEVFPAGDRAPAAEAGLEKPIAIVQVEDVIGARLSRVRIVIASDTIAAGDRLELIEQ